MIKHFYEALIHRHKCVFVVFIRLETPLFTWPPW